MYLPAAKVMGRVPYPNVRSAHHVDEGNTSLQKVIRLREWLFAAKDRANGAELR